MPIRRIEAHYDYMRVGDVVAKIVSPGNFLIDREMPLPDRPWTAIRETTRGHTQEWVLFPDRGWVNGDGELLDEAGIVSIESFEVVRG